MIIKKEIQCALPLPSSLLPPPLLPLSSFSLSSSVALLPKPYIFQAHRKDTKLFVIAIIFQESFILMGAVSVDCGCAADTCSGINGLQDRTAGKPGSPCCVLPLPSATAVVSVTHTPFRSGWSPFLSVSCLVFITPPVAVITPAQLG